MRVPVFFFTFFRIEAVDPERVFLDLEKLGTVEFWEDQSHIRCLVDALQKDRNVISPRKSFFLLMTVKVLFFEKKKN